MGPAAALLAERVASVTRAEHWRRLEAGAAEEAARAELAAQLSGQLEAATQRQAKQLARQLKHLLLASGTELADAIAGAEETDDDAWDPDPESAGGVEAAVACGPPAEDTPPAEAEAEPPRPPVRGGDLLRALPVQEARGRRYIEQLEVLETGDAEWRSGVAALQLTAWRSLREEAAAALFGIATAEILADEAAGRAAAAVEADEQHTALQVARHRRAAELRRELRVRRLRDATCAAHDEAEKAERRWVATDEVHHRARLHDLCMRAAPTGCAVPGAGPPRRLPAWAARIPPRCHTARQAPTAAPAPLPPRRPSSARDDGDDSGCAPPPPYGDLLRLLGSTPEPFREG